MSIVEERNRLIHTDLLKFHPNSLDSCKEISERLDAQHEKILPEFEALQSILSSFQEGRLRIAEYIQSDAFTRDFNNAKNGG